MSQADPRPQNDAGPCPTLPWSKPPIVGESLMGFLVRQTALHGIDRVAPVLRAAGIDTLFPEGLPTTHRDKADAVATLLRTTPDEIALRCHPPVDLPERPAGFLGFFGVPIRAIYREPSRRRFSPASLAHSAHHRALWDLRVFCFCPESMQTLASTCPHCDARLGWRWTVGVAACEHCGGDLRDASPPRVECDDREALDLVVSLVDPDPKRRVRASRLLPKALAGFDDGELFEACVGLAWAEAVDAAAPNSSQRFVAGSDFEKLTPHALARGGRCIMDWPSSFHALVDGHRARSGERPGFWGMEKELGSLVRLMDDVYLAPRFRDLLSREVRLALDHAGVPLRRAAQRALPDLMTVTGAEREFGIACKTLRQWRAEDAIWSRERLGDSRSRALVRRSEIADIAAARQDAVCRIDVARLLGVDYLAVARLADAGMFARVEGPAVDLLVGENFRRSSIQDLVARLEAKAGPGASDAMTVAAAIKTIPVKVVPWVGIFHAILTGALEVAYHDGEDGLTMALTVEPSQLARVVLAAPEEPLNLAVAERINTHEAAAALGTTGPVLAAFTGDGLLPTIGEGALKLRPEDVLAFRAKFILSGEIAQRLGMPIARVRRWLADQGIAPAQVCRDGKIAVFDRPQVEAAIGVARFAVTCVSLMLS